MFSGIVKGVGTVVQLDKRSDVWTIGVLCSETLTEGIDIGASVAINGVCLTIIRYEQSIIFFDLILETIQKTTLGQVVVGTRVNVERSLKFGDEIGGHLVSGHVLCTGSVVVVHKKPETIDLTIKLPQQYSKYVIEKGFIAINGASLTIGQVHRAEGTFAVYLIPETCTRTTFGEVVVGDLVNIEIDPNTKAVVDNITY